MAYVTVEDFIWPDGITDDQKKIFRIKGYYMPIMIGDKLCGLFQNYPDEYLVVGIGTDGTFDREYLYKNNQSACDALNSYKNLNEHPSGPWVKCEGTFNGEEIEVLNPESEK